MAKARTVQKPEPVEPAEPAQTDEEVVIEVEQTSVTTPSSVRGQDIQFPRSFYEE